MTAVWIRVRAEFRSRSRAIIALVVMIGLAAGVVMAATAGGRRTESAYPRFVKAQQALSFVITPSDSSGLANLDQIARLPEVVDSTTVWSIPGIVTVGGEQLRFPEILPLVDPTNAFGTRINSFKILSGRTFDPHRPKIPVLLAGLLGLLSGATLAHTLLTSIRRRRRDLAILKTVGFVRRQVGSTVAWQASTLVVISLLIGIPAGIAAGRWSWRLFTDQLGVVPSPVLPTFTLIIVGVGTLLLSNAVALLPGRVAARTSPAVVLRSE